MKKLTLSIVISLMTFSSLAYSVAYDNPEMIWLTLDPGGRPGGMGRAFVAVSDDTSATYWNPAGLASLEKRSVSFMHAPRSVDALSGMFYDYFVYAHPTEKFGTFALSTTYYDVGKSDRTDEEGRYLGTIHSYFVAPWVSWGYSLLPFLDVGASFRVANQHLTDDDGGSTTAFMGDVGVMYTAPVPALLTENKDASALKIGLAAVHLGPDIERETETTAGIETKSTPLPRTLRFGVSYKIMDDELNDFLITTEIDKFLMNLGGEQILVKNAAGDYLDDAGAGFSADLGYEISEAVARYGIEYIYADIIGVRMGYYYDHPGEIVGFDFGFGVDYFGMGFDFASVYEGQLFNRLNRFEINYEF